VKSKKEVLSLFSSLTYVTAMHPVLHASAVTDAQVVECGDTKVVRLIVDFYTWKNNHHYPCAGIQSLFCRTAYVSPGGASPGFKKAAFWT
jgi:hypothetical protein